MFLTKNKCLGKNLNANHVYNNVRILIEEELRSKFLKHDALVLCHKYFLLFFLRSGAFGLLFLYFMNMNEKLLQQTQLKHEILLFDIIVGADLFL